MFTYLTLAVLSLPQDPLAQAAAEAARTVVFKLHDNLSADAVDGRLLGRSGEVAAVAALLPANAVKRYFTQTPQELAEFRLRALQRSAWPQPVDLGLYFSATAASAEAAAALAENLAALSGVAHAYVHPQPAPPPTDIPPTTPDYSAQQDYFEAPLTGTNQFTVAGALGARGRGLRVTDCEYAWVIDHEDLELPPSRYLGGTPAGFFPEHGTAVLGELYAQDNGYGVTGGVPQAEIYMSTEFPAGGSFNPTQSIINAALNSQAGDVILLEMQTVGPTGAYCPEEWTQASFDAIQSATAAGIHVVEAGGNGGTNLDSGVYQNKFNVNVRDSGAVIVGAGDSATRTRMWFTSYGSRVDCQAWGENVTTAGYGDLFQAGSNDRQDYTSGFSGTSSASPIVTSAVAALLGALEVHGRPAPTPRQVRDALRATGSPQPDAASGRIGPLPDLEALFDWFNLPDGLRHAPKATLGGSLTLNLSGNSNEPWVAYHALDTQVLNTPQGTRVLGNDQFRSFASGTLNGAGSGQFTASVPNRPALAGREAYLQVLFNNARWSNGGAVTLR